MKNFFKSLGLGLAFAAIFVGIQSMVSVAMSFYFSFVLTIEQMRNGEQPDVETMTLQLMDKIMESQALLVIISGVISLLLVCIIFKARHEKIKEQLYLTPITKKSIPVLLILGVSLNLLISGILALLPIPAEILQGYEQQSAALTQVSVVTLLATVIVAPVVEEVFCRGLMLSRFQKGMPTAVAIVLQAFIFGLLHGNPLWITYATVIGIVFGVVAHKQKSIIGSIILHFSFNVTSFIMSAINFSIESTVAEILITLISGIIFVAVTALALKKKLYDLPEVNEAEVQ